MDHEGQGRSETVQVPTWIKVIWFATAREERHGPRLLPRKLRSAFRWRE